MGSDTRALSRDDDSRLPGCGDLTDDYRAGNSRKVVTRTLGAEGDEQSARRLRVNEQRSLQLRGASPLDQRVDELEVPFGAAGPKSGEPCFARTGEQGDIGANDSELRVARSRDVREMTEQAEAGDVGGATAVERDCGAASNVVERRHRRDERGQVTSDQLSGLGRRRKNASADGLRENQDVADSGASVGEHAAWVDPASNGQAKLYLVVGDCVATNDYRARRVDDVLPSAENLAEHFDRQLARREGSDVHRGEGLAAHRVDIGQCVGGCNATEVVRVIDDRREEVNGLDEGEIVGQAKDPRVVEGLMTDKQTGINAPGERRERTGEVARTQLGRSTSAARELRQTEQLLAGICHGDDR